MKKYVISLLLASLSGLAVAMEQTAQPAALSPAEVKLFDAVKQGAKNERLAQLVKEGANINARDQYGQTPLHYAARYYESNMIPELVGLGADPNAQDDQGQTPLYFAVHNNDPATVHMLIAADANPIVPLRDGTTPWSIAEAGGNPEIVSLLRPTAEPAKLAQEQAERDLFDAIYSKTLKPDQFNKLIGQGARINIENQDGKTPLQVALERNNMQALGLLLQEEANISATDKEGKTLLHMAIEANNPYAVQLLLKKDKDKKILHARDINGNTPLHLAVTRGNPEIVRNLLDAGATVDADVRNTPGATPRLLAEAIGRPELVTLFQAIGKKEAEAGMSQEGRSLYEEALESIKSGAPIPLPKKKEQSPIAGKELGEKPKLTFEQQQQEKLKQQREQLAEAARERAAREPARREKLAKEERIKGQELAGQSNIGAFEDVLTPEIAWKPFALGAATTLGGLLLSYLGYKTAHAPETSPITNIWDFNEQLTNALKQKRFEQAYKLAKDNRVFLYALVAYPERKRDLIQLIRQSRTDLMYEPAEAAESINPLEYARPSLPIQLKYLADLLHLIESASGY